MVDKGWCAKWEADTQLCHGSLIWWTVDRWCLGINDPDKNWIIVDGKTWLLQKLYNVQKRSCTLQKLWENKKTNSTLHMQNSGHSHQMAGERNTGKSQTCRKETQKVEESSCQPTGKSSLSLPGREQNNQNIDKHCSTIPYRLLAIVEAISIAEPISTNTNIAPISTTSWSFRTHGTYQPSHVTTRPLWVSRTSRRIAGRGSKPSSVVRALTLSWRGQGSVNRGWINLEN